MNSEWLERDKNVLAGVLPRCTDVVAKDSHGSWVYDTEDRRYLDFASGIAASSTGHCHPDVVSAICKQAKTLIHTSVVTHNTLNIELAERLGGLCPFFEEPQVFFTNSGAEAVDGSMKLARRVTGQSGVIAFQGAFHGRTIAATTLTTAKKKYRNGYSPFLPYVYHAPYGGSLGMVDEILTAGPPRYPYKVGAVIVEPILGEGGYIVPPDGWLQGLRSLCDLRGALLIFDEVQTGIWRTAYPFAAETFGVTPDVILFAKGIASGMPLGGIIAPTRIMEQWPEGTHGSTFGGNPVSCAAALATLEILEPLQQKIWENGVWIRRYLRNALQFGYEYPVRGVGMMNAIELPSKEMCDAVRQRCQDLGLIVLSCGPGENVLRLIPPLTISDEDLDIGLRIIVKAIKRETNKNEY